MEVAMDFAGDCYRTPVVNILNFVIKISVTVHFLCFLDKLLSSESCRHFKYVWITMRLA